eukprot:365122-Chlamydomonas_euryale.AAC.12
MKPTSQPCMHTTVRQHIFAHCPSQPPAYQHVPGRGHRYGDRDVGCSQPVMGALLWRRGWLPSRNVKQHTCRRASSPCGSSGARAAPVCVAHARTASTSHASACDVHTTLVPMQVPGAGRGLVAAAPLSYGETLFVERPMLVAPSAELNGRICHGCLSVLMSGPVTTLRSPLSGRPFCSERCMAACDAGWHALESLAMREEAADGGSRGLDCGLGGGGGGSGALAAAGGALEDFEAACFEAGERFPLMAARLACARLTAAVTSGGAGGADNADGAGTAAARRPSHCAGASPDAAADAGVVSGEPLLDAGFLCYANVTPPYPPPWLRMHSALASALRGAVARAEAQLPAGSAASSALRRELSALDAAWFARTLAALHVNVFRIGALLPPDGGGGGGGGGAAFGPTSSGSAAFLLASLFNHSCEPNVEVREAGQGEGGGRGTPVF